MSSVRTPSVAESAKAHTGIPTYFRALCSEAQQGGASSFRQVGYQFAAHIATEQPYGLDEEEWDGKLSELRELVAPSIVPDHSLRPELPTEDKGFRAKVWQWFETHFPRMMALIPARRRSQFLLGFFDAVEDESVCLEM